jgi:uncharacterized protein YggT (Ycf19 family)
MFILHRLLQAIATVLGYAVDAYILMVLVHALLSWVNPDPRNPIRPVPRRGGRARPQAVPSHPLPV